MSKVYEHFKQFEEEGPEHPDEMRPKYRHRAFLRSTSNVNSTTGQRQVGLPPKIWKQMGWKLNENLQIDIIKRPQTPSINIMKEEE